MKELTTEQAKKKFDTIHNHELFFKRYKLTEEFVEKRKHRFTRADWNCICIFQSLSEDFIEKYQDRLQWWLISEYQKLSIDFIIRNVKRIDIECLKQNTKINQKEIQDKEIYLMLEFLK